MTDPLYKPTVSANEVEGDHLYANVRSNASLDLSSYEEGVSVLIPPTKCGVAERLGRNSELFPVWCEPDLRRD